MFFALYLSVKTDRDERRTSRSEQKLCGLSQTYPEAIYSSHSKSRRRFCVQKKTPIVGMFYFQRICNEAMGPGPWVTSYSKDSKAFMIALWTLPVP